MEEQLVADTAALYFLSRPDVLQVNKRHPVMLLSAKMRVHFPQRFNPDRVEPEYAFGSKI